VEDGRLAFMTRIPQKPEIGVPFWYTPGWVMTICVLVFPQGEEYILATAGANRSGSRSSSH
jgi:hypothetical protein